MFVLDDKALVSAVPTIKPYMPHLLAAMKRWDITTELRICHFLAQMAVESGVFTTVVESLNYREDKLIPLFGSRRISLADAHKYGRSIDGKRKANQEALANILYGGKWGLVNLGNSQPGDGWKYRGRGLKQITGRVNYIAVSGVLFDDDRLLANPNLLEKPEYAAMSAGAYWDSRDLNHLADEDDVETITLKVNGGTNGLEGTGGRRWWVERFKTIL